MTEALQPLARSHERAALSYLARAPFENVFLSWLIENDRASATRSSLYVYASNRDDVRGVGFFGRQVVIAATDDAAIGAFAEHARTHRHERMIVGERSTVERYWACVRDRHAPPRLVRKSQPLFAIDRGLLRRAQGDVTVRRAHSAEWETVAHNSAKMIEQELDYDPRSFSAGFNANVRLMIDRGVWWVGQSDGKLCFFCNAGPRSAQTLQLQGIWTPPDMRGRGLATVALAGICEQLLDELPTLSLYVNSFNDKAVALYERVGFRRAGEFQTLLF